MAFTSLLTTELDSLPAGNAAIDAGTFDNAAAGTLYMFGDFLLTVTMPTTPVSGELIDIYLIPALDGTNYADGSTSILPPTCQRGSFPVRAVNTIQKLVIHGAILPPCKFKMIVVNGTSDDFDTTGNILAILPYGQALT